VRTVTLRTTSVGGGKDTLGVSPAGSVRVSHTGEATSVVVELGGTGSTGLPAAFVTPQVRVGAGETLTFSPRWGSLDGRSLSITRTTANGAERTINVRNAARAAVHIGSPRLAVKIASRRATLTIAASLTGPARSGAGTTVTFLVLRGKRTVASHTVPVMPEALRRGVAWRTKRLPAGRYTFVGGVAAFGPTPQGLVLDGASRSKRVAFRVG
jgi:hypothetical protein